MKKLLILLCFFALGIINAKAQDPVYAGFCIETDSDGNGHIVFWVYCNQPVVITLECSGFLSDYTHASNQFYPEKSLIRIGYSYTDDWEIIPGERVYLKVAGVAEETVEIPLQGTADWDNFEANLEFPPSQSETQPLEFPITTQETEYQQPQNAYQATERVCPHCKGTRKDPYAYTQAPHYGVSDRSCCNIPKDQPGSCKVSKICQLCNGTGTVK